MEMCRRSAALQIDWSTLALNETVSVRLVFVSKLKTCSMAMCSFQAFQFSRANLNLLLLLNTLQFQEDPYFHLYLYPLDPFGSLGWPYKAKNKATKCEVTRYAETCTMLLATAKYCLGCHSTVHARRHIFLMGRGQSPVASKQTELTPPSTCKEQGHDGMMGM